MHCWCTLQHQYTIYTLCARHCASDSTLHCTALYPLCCIVEEELEAARQLAEQEGRAPQYDGRWRDADAAEVQAKLDAGVPHTYRFKVPHGSVSSVSQ
jgi:hypothetical protein